MAGHNNWPYIINLGNSIIGVAVLAMPFCFKQCGIILAMLVLLFCTWLTLASCQLLMKAGIGSRRRSYEFLAYFTHGAAGKFLSEVGMIGMQVGTLIAQIVVIGDLGPAILSKILGLENSSNLRTFLIITLCLCVGLPLGLLKDLRAVSRASTVCITFYTFFILYVVYLSLPNLWSGAWYPHVRFWRIEGLFQCLPILSFSFGCQTQLFLLYDALPEPSLKSISSVISSAVNLCAVAYLVVGFFGYVTFYAYEVPGDVLAIFPPTVFADAMKMCFVFSIVITFPVIIFPCRASIYTLLFSKKTKLHDDNIEGDVYMSEQLFKGITICIVLGSMITGILIPNVEFILGINGAIVGTLICYIFPALFFLRVMSTKTEGKLVAQVVLVLGISIMLLSSYATLNSQDKGQNHVVERPVDLMPPDKLINGVPGVTHAKPDNDVIDDTAKVKALNDDAVNDKDLTENVKERRQEPPNPDPPDTIETDFKRKRNGSVLKDTKLNPESGEVKTNTEKPKDKEIDSANEAKEDELKDKEKKQDEILHELEKHRNEQEKLLREQRELLKELKNHQEDDHKEDSVGKKTQKEPADAIQKEIVNQQKEIINQQQKVIEQQQEQLNQQKNNPQIPVQVNQQPPVNNLNQQPLVNNLNQQPLVNNLNPQPLVNNLNQQPPINNLNQGPLVNNLNQQPLVNNLNQGLPVNNLNPQPPINNLNQGPPVNNLNQQPPINNLNQGPPINNLNQGPPVNNLNPQPPINNLNQGPPVNNLNQQPPINNLNPQPPINNLNQGPPVNNLNQQPPINNLNQQPPVNNLKQQAPIILNHQPIPANNLNPHPQINLNQKQQINQQQQLNIQKQRINQ